MSDEQRSSKATGVTDGDRALDFLSDFGKVYEDSGREGYDLCTTDVERLIQNVRADERALLNKGDTGQAVLESVAIAAEAHDRYDQPSSRAALQHALAAWKSLPCAGDTGPELDSPNFVPQAAKDLEARGFERVNQPARCRCGMNVGACPLHSEHYGPTMAEVAADVIATGQQLRTSEASPKVGDIVQFPRGNPRPREGTVIAIHGPDEDVSRTGHTLRVQWNDCSSGSVDPNQCVVLRSGDARPGDLGLIRETASGGHHPDCDCDRQRCTCAVHIAEAALRLLTQRSEAVQHGPCASHVEAAQAANNLAAEHAAIAYEEGMRDGYQKGVMGEREAAPFGLLRSSWSAMLDLALRSRHWGAVTDVRDEMTGKKPRPAEASPGPWPETARRWACHHVPLCPSEHEHGMQNAYDAQQRRERGQP